ncbi:hypothetical protein RB298_05130, partial [Priestia sp. BR_2]
VLIVIRGKIKAVTRFFLLLYTTYKASLHNTSSEMHHKKERHTPQGAVEFSFSGLCSFLYILGMTGLS